MSRFKITRNDIIPVEEYAKIRDQRRQKMVESKKHRRVSVGPDVTFYFENYDTMLHQIQEMLHIERGGDEQLADELDAYNPLVPGGDNLVATMMIEIDDPVRRARALYDLAGIDEAVTISFADFIVRAEPINDTERTTEAGKTSSVHFLKFNFSTPQIGAFCKPDTRAILGTEHPAYQHMAVLPETSRATLAAGFSA